MVSFSFLLFELPDCKICDIDIYGRKKAGPHKYDLCIFEFTIKKGKYNESFKLPLQIFKLIAFKKRISTLYLKKWIGNVLPLG